MQDYVQRLQQLARQPQGRGGFPGGGMPPVPRGAGALVAGAVLLGTGAYVLQNALFNVDGGHRAIKYRRISGVSKEIYTEGSCRKPKYS